MLHRGYEFSHAASNPEISSRKCVCICVFVRVCLCVKMVVDGITVKEASEKGFPIRERKFRERLERRENEVAGKR